MKDIILTGVKPTGTPHIGNYLGAIKPAIELSKTNNNAQQYYFIADYHALTTVETAKQLSDLTYEVAATWLACGLDPKKVVFYKQSDIAEIFELAAVLNNVTPKGLMNRAHAYKAKVQENTDNNLEQDANINMGLYCYPILMAADILLFNTKYVPVGQDQKQHIEIARDIAQSFNYRYGQVFTLPEPIIQKEVSIITGLDGRKMSKSYNNTITLFASQDELEKTIKKIVTDSSAPNEPKSTDCTLFKLYEQFATKQQVENMKNRFELGIGWGDAKKALFEVMNEQLKPLRDKYNYYMQNKHLVDEALLVGAQTAKAVAQKTIAQMRKAIGINFKDLG